MKFRSLTSLLLFFGLHLLMAQNSTFDIGANIQYMPSSEKTILQPGSTITIQSINDSTQVQSYYDSKQEYIKSYTADLGFEVMTEVKFKIGKHLSFKSGLGVNIWRLQSTEQYQGIVESVLTSIDTISTAPSTNVFTSYCDTYLNSSSELGIDDAVQYNLINLRIPFIFSYGHLY